MNKKHAGSGAPESGTFSLAFYEKTLCRYLRMDQEILFSVKRSHPCERDCRKILLRVFSQDCSSRFPSCRLSQSKFCLYHSVTTLQSFVLSPSCPPFYSYSILLSVLSLFYLHPVLCSISCSHSIFRYSVLFFVNGKRRIPVSIAEWKHFPKHVTLSKSSLPFFR